MNKLLVTALMSAGLLGTAPLVIAQTASPQGDTQQVRPGPRAGHMHRHAHVRPTERVEARLAYIRTALKITDAQQPQWEAFANVLRKQAQQTEQFMQTRHTERAQAPGGQRPQVTAIDRLERRQKMMTLASQRLDEVIAAAKPLYASLSPDQQKIADDMIAKRGRGGFGHGGHRGMHRGA